MKKVKELREHNDDNLELAEITPRTSYCIVPADVKKQGAEFANALTLSYVLQVNLLDGVYIGRSLLGYYVEIDNKKLPTEKYSVISKVNRKEKVFQKIIVESMFIDVLCSALNINNQGLKTYAKRNLSKKPFDTAYYYLSLINRQCIHEKEFDVKQAGEILKERAFESPYWFKDKYIITVDSISSFKLPNLVTLFKLFKDEGMDVQQVIGWLAYIEKDNVPEYMQEEVTNVKTANFKNNLLKIMASAINTSDIKELFYKTLRFV